SGGFRTPPRYAAALYQNSQTLTHAASAPLGHSLQKRTVVQWDTGAVLGRDGGTDESIFPHFGITPSSRHQLSRIALGELLEVQRHRQAKRFDGLEVDYQLEFGRRLHGKLARLGTL